MSGIVVAKQIRTGSGDGSQQLGAAGRQQTSGAGPVVQAVDAYADQLLAAIQPNVFSEIRRRCIAQHVCNLIKKTFQPQRQVGKDDCRVCHKLAVPRKQHTESTTTNRPFPVVPPPPHPTPDHKYQPCPLPFPYPG
jgi:hypothetical protein